MEISRENLYEMIKQAKGILSTVNSIIEEAINEKIWRVLEIYGFNRDGFYEGAKSDEEIDFNLDKVKTEVERIYHEYEGFYREIIDDFVKLYYWVENDVGYNTLTFFIKIVNANIFIEEDDSNLYEFQESFDLGEENVDL